MSDSTKAVFLSYASQDAAAAKRICDAMRAGGVEVWFDADGGLEHGDEWDAKIRRQIKECVLFIPVISACTQARHEGYFRIEWELAAQRAMGIASGVPFILPVVIDDTREPEALVPDRFRAVQWTRLRGGEVPPEVQQRFLKLWSHRTGVLKHEAAVSHRQRADSSASAAVGGAKHQSAWLWVVLAVVVAVPAYLIFRPRRSPEEIAKVLAQVETVVADATKAPAAPSEAEQLVKQARDLIYDPDSARNEFGLAENMLKRATELAPTSGDAWGASALLNHYFYSRAYDRERSRLARSLAEADKALRLSPHNTDALLAMALHREAMGEKERARDFLEQAHASDPQNYKVIRAQSLQFTDWVERACFTRDAAARVSRPAELYYYAANDFDFAGRWDEAREMNNRAIAAQPFWRAFVQGAVIEYAATADPAKVDAWLDRVSELKRDEPRVAFMRSLAAFLRRDGATAVRVLNALAADYLEDNFYTGPKSYLLALAYELAGQPERALEQWQLTERVVREKLAVNPSDRFMRPMLAVVLAAQQRMDEARQTAAACAADERVMRDWIAREILAGAYVRLGEPDRAIALLSGERRSTQVWGNVSAATLAAEPRWDTLRDRPGYAQLLAELRRAENGGAGRPAPAGALLSEARQLAAKARALFDSLDGTRDDYKLAEELMAQAKAKDGLDAEVCAAEAQLHERFLQRGWDTSDARREAARAAAQRAIRLDPRSFEARLAQAGLLAYTGSEGEEKVRQLRELRRERPTDQRVLRTLGTGLDRLGRLDEAVATLDESAALPGGDPLALYTKSQIYWWAGRTAEAEAAIEASIAQKPFTSALLMSVWYKARLRGDLDGARALLNRINPAEMVEDRACWFAYYVEWLARRPDAAIAHLAVVPRDWLNDNFHRGPKAALVGDAQQLAGRPDVAALEWRAALKLVDQRLAASPNDWRLLSQRVGLLTRLGQGEEAEHSLGVLTQLLGSEPDVTAFALSRVYTLLGRKAEAIAQISAGLKRGKRAVQFTAADLRLNPDWDPLRRDPAFTAVIAEAEAIEKAVANPGGGAAVPAPIIDEKSVAVLAFANLSDDKNNEYFSDGISEELLTVLQKIPGLHVAARTSAFSFKGKNATDQEIGEKLGVAHIVEGSVQKSGSRVKVTARLSRAATGEELWSQSYTRELKDVFALQEELALAIVGELRGQLGGGDNAAAVRAAVKGGTANPEAHQQFLQGRFHLSQFSIENMSKAIGCFERATALDPTFALAWAGLARTHALHVGWSDRLTRQEFDAELAQARATADRALALEPDLPEALGARFEIQFNYDFDWKGAAATVRRILALAPSDPIVLGAASRVAGIYGERERAVDLARQAVALDPVNSEIRVYLGIALLGARRLAEARTEYARVVELNPGTPWAYAGTGLAYLYEGRYAEAVAAAAPETAGFARMVVSAIGLWGQKKTAEADAVLAQMIKEDADVGAYQIAEVHAFRGDKDQAFVWLDRAHRQRDAGLATFTNDPFLDQLRTDPRWAAFQRTMSLAADQLQ
jgi:TolB-like protein/Flp pilus assembly protein TadD